MNWGTGITIGMIAFMSFIVILVTKMIGQKVDLVQEGYYKSDLDYEKQQAKQANYLALAEKVEISLKADNILVAFPKEEINKITSGTIVLFRPSEKREDKSVNLKLDQSGRQLFPISNLSRGLWKVKLEWNEGKRDFYTEKELILP